MKNLIILFLLIVVSINGQSKKLSLNESLEIGLKNSKDIKIAKSVVKQSDYEQKEYSGYLLPKLSFGASYSRLSKVDPFQITMPFSPNPIKIQDAILNNYNLKLNLQQPLFTGFKLSSLKESAENKYTANELELENEKNKTAFNIITAYYNYFKSIKVLQIVTENSERLKQHLEDTKVFVENGLATTNDLLKIEVRYNNNELLKINAANNLELAKTQFNKTIGVELNERTDIELIEPNVNEIKTDYNTDLTIAFAERLELKSLRYRLQSANNLITASKSFLYPNIYLTGNVYYNRPNQREMPLKDEFKDTWDISLVLNWELWDWDVNSSKVEQTTEVKNQLETKYQQLKESVEQEVYSNYLKVISEYNKIKVSKLMLRSSEENYRISKEKYNNQLLTSSDLIDAETNLLDSQISLTNSLIDYELAVAAYTKSLGKKLY